jgi:hypothetical protein
MPRAALVLALCAVLAALGFFAYMVATFWNPKEIDDGLDGPPKRPIPDVRRETGEGQSPGATPRDPVAEFVGNEWHKRIEFGPPRSPSGVEIAAFGKIFAGIAASTPATVLQFVDPQAFLAERVRTTAGGEGDAPVTTARYRRWSEEFTTATKSRLAGGPHAGWNETRILSVIPSTDATRMIVIARHTWTDRPDPCVMEWRFVAWMNESWVVYDYADTSLWVRRSVAAADAEAGTTGFTGPEGETEIGGLTWAATVSNAKYYDALNRVLATHRGKKLSPALSALRAYDEGRLRMLGGKPAEALPFFVEASTLDLDWPLPYAGAAAALNALGKPNEALSAALNATSRVGPWPPAAAEQAAALKSLGRADEATGVLKASEGVYPTPKSK